MSVAVLFVEDEPDDAELLLREERAFLCAHGCDQVQGFLFSRPVPAAEAAGLLARGSLSV